MNIHRPVSSIMSTDLKTVDPLVLMTDVAEIFDTNNIHHLPVISDEGLPLGIISRHDYNQLQHHFTRKGWEMAEAANKKLFRTMTAKEVMTTNPVTLDKDASIQQAVDFFLTNLLHSVLVTDEGKCVGIVTPHDVIKEMSKLVTVLQ